MSLFNLFERRSLENPGRPLTDASLMELFGGAKGDAGVAVTPTGSLKMSAVYRAVSLIGGLGGALPLRTYRSGTHRRESSALLENPHPDLTPLELWRLSYLHRCLWGNSYSQKVRNNAGQVTWLYPITPDRVTVEKIPPTSANPSGKVFTVIDEWGSSHVLSPNEILHIPGLGYDGVCGMSPIKLAAQGIGMALAAEKHAARLFGSGNLLSGFIRTEQRLEQKQADALRTRWREKMAGLENSHDVGVLDSGAQFQSLTMPNDDAQLLESRHFQVSDVGRWYGIPAYLMGQTEKATSWGTGLEQQAQGFVTFDLHPMWLAPTEQRITKELLSRNRYAKYSLEGLLRGDSTARAAFYTAMRNIGVLNVDEIRELEDREPLPDDQGTSYLSPLNMGLLGPDGTVTAVPGAGTTPVAPAVDDVAEDPAAA